MTYPVKRFAYPTRHARIELVTKLINKEITQKEVCDQTGVDESRVNEWIRRHASDRLLSLSEFRTPAELPGHLRGLFARVGELESLLKTKQREISMLEMLIRSKFSARRKTNDN